MRPVTTKFPLETGNIRSVGEYPSEAQGLSHFQTRIPKHLKGRRERGFRGGRVEECLHLYDKPDEGLGQGRVSM